MLAGGTQGLPDSIIFRQRLDRWLVYGTQLTRRVWDVKEPSIILSSVGAIVLLLAIHGSLTSSLLLVVPSAFFSSVLKLMGSFFC